MFMRISLYILGFASLITGFIGVFIPLLPTTPFLILAAWCFVRSSPWMHSWLYNQSIFSKSLRDWDERGVIRPRNKTIAILLILSSSAIVWFKIDYLIIKVPLLILFMIVILFLLSRPNG